MEVISPYGSFNVDVENMWEWDVVGEILKKMVDSKQSTIFRRIDIYFDENKTYVIPIGKKTTEFNFYGKSNTTNCKWKPN